MSLMKHFNAMGMGIISKNKSVTQQQYPQYLCAGRHFTQALLPSVALLLWIPAGSFKPTFKMPTPVHFLASSFSNFASDLLQSFVWGLFCEMEFVKVCGYLT